MRSNKTILRPVSLAVAVSMLGTTAYLPAAQAALVGTEAALEAQQVLDERARVDAVLQRADLQAKLMEHGVDPAQVQARVAGLSDAEIRQLAQQLDQLPAGAGGLELLLLVFIILLLTDIAGLTNIFTFTR